MRKPHCSQGGGVFVCVDGGNTPTPRLFSGMTGEGLYGQEYEGTGEGVIVASAHWLWADVVFTHAVF